MKRIALYGCGLMLAFMMPGPVAAHDYHDCDEAKMMGCDHEGMKASHGKGAGMMMGRHGMTGTIESIDHQTGWIKVKTGEGSLNVHFPPDSTKDLKNGDVIDVHMSFSKVEEAKGRK